MRNIALILFVLINFSCQMRSERGKVIDRMISAIESEMPMDINGIIWTDLINEDDTKSVHIYDVPNDKLEYFSKNISKEKIMLGLKSIPEKGGYKTTMENDIIKVFRYYNNDKLLKEIEILPSEWEGNLNNNSDDFQSVLTITSQKINDMCPMVVDKDTRLDNTVVLSNKKIQYNYTMINNIAEDFDADYLEIEFVPNLINQVKTNPGLELFRQNNVTFSYYYQDKNGKFILNTIIKPEMYNK